MGSNRDGDNGEKNGNGGGQTTGRGMADTMTMAGRWMAEKTTTGRGTTMRRGMTVTTTMDDEVEVEDKDGMRTG